jgi:hypothetical protein
MKSESWIVIECLTILALMGGASFFFEPKYSFGVGVVLTAVVSILNNALGAKTGGTMPQQTTDAKPGQSSQADTHVITVPEPPPAEKKT